MIDDRELTQAEKRQVMENDRLVRKASTYFHQAQVDATSELGGRYSSAVAKVTVTGSDPRLMVPRQPAAKEMEG